MAVFLLFFCTPGSQLATGGVLADVEDNFVVVDLFVAQAVVCGSLSRRGARTRDDVRGATQKSVVPRSARRLASSGVAPTALNASYAPYR